jgi:hypothetical protein
MLETEVPDGHVRTISISSSDTTLRKTYGLHGDVKIIIP